MDKINSTVMYVIMESFPIYNAIRDTVAMSENSLIMEAKILHSERIRWDKTAERTDKSVQRKSQPTDINTFTLLPASTYHGPEIL